MKCQSLFSEKNKKNIVSWLSVEYTQRVVKVFYAPVEDHTVT